LRVLVTGGASGIGLAVAELMREQGAAVAVLDTAPSEDRGFLHELGDVTDPRAVNRAVTACVERLDGLDVLINNAGVGAQGTIEENDDDEWHHVFDVNVIGIVRVSREALPALRASRRAAIVNISSIVATLGLPDRALYAASKGAVHALTLAMAVDLLPHGIRVNSVAPGTADTPWITRLLDRAEDPVAERAALESRQPHGRLIAPREIAAAVAFLASPASGSINGTAVAVDGGMIGLRSTGDPRRSPRPTAIPSDRRP
jgi:2-keto-3-deoxy-L-fuconate dehydrogenase